VDIGWTQAGSRIRFDWGPDGADAIGPGADLVAVVDVLSFTTTLTVAVERGIAVLPHRWSRPEAEIVARENAAVLAAGRRAAGPGQVSLSPESVLRSSGIRRLVLPSPNGSTISARLAETGATVLGVSLRNADAAAGAVLRRLGAGATVAVVAAGERWPGGALRPAVEDLWGAGSFIHSLVRRGAGDLSVEAMTALTAYRSVVGDLGSALRDCASGRELRGQGFGGDVEVAAQTGGVVVPILRDGWFVAESDDEGGQVGT
jgi:2-phosphosulfolactate phosphatase